MNYGGIRSPDNEIVFRVAESLGKNGTFNVTYPLTLWKEFGIAKGKDNKNYSIFSPLESILLVPMIKVSKLINMTYWYDNPNINVPLSFYVKIGLINFINEKKSQPIEPHALRFLVSFFNVLISSLVVFVFWLIGLRLFRCQLSAFLVSILFAFGTLLFPYSGTLFSEPLASLFSLLSFYFLIKNDLKIQIDKKAISSIELFLSGLTLGVSCTAHITSLLFFPFFVIYGVYLIYQRNERLSRFIITISFFLAGFFLVIFLLGFYNFMRFGNFLETGRTVNMADVLKYSHWVVPWRGFYGLSFSLGKGLFLYCPAVIFGIIVWNYFHRKNIVLSITIISMLAFRFMFISLRSDWHGGFCLGPRHLIITIPFFLIAIGFWLDSFIKKGDQKGPMLFSICFFICVIQQLYFCVGEVFSFLQIIRFQCFVKKINIFKGDAIYFKYQTSPLFHLLKSKRGPFLLQNIYLNNYIIWIIFIIITVFLIFIIYKFVILKNLAVSPLCSDEPASRLAKSRI